MRLAAWIGSFLMLCFPATAQAAPAAEDVQLPLWSIAPFVILLLTIAILPLLAGHWWESNRNKAIVAAVIGIPTALYLLSIGPVGQRGLLHELEAYFSFIVLLWSLYVVSGGILLTGDIQARPTTNAFFLGLGAVLANLLGTTGASMLLIRPVLRINQERVNTRHVPIFFIFLVSNLGGLLTPLGDPPLFLGFLKGVDFFWTLRLWPQWLLVNGVVLGIFLVWDTLAYRHEPIRARAADVRQIEPLRLKGSYNFLLILGIIIAVLAQSEAILGARALRTPWGELIMLAMGGLSLLCTPRTLRQQNRFSWHAITEVAILFAAIFVTLGPAIYLLKTQGKELTAGLGITEPWQYFWLTGILSSVLDNAPTYVALATVAAGSDHFQALSLEQPLILAAISCGAVFMGANTYIGNGPNFMVKAIAEEAGYKMPSFFGYLAYSGGILLPVFVLVTLLFFWPF